MVVRPGDTLIIAMGESMTSEEAERMRRELRAHIPMSVGIAVIEGAVGFAAYRPEPEAQPTVAECPNAGCEHFRKPVEISLRTWGSAVESVGVQCRECGWVMGVPA
jgi:hypothetical protein